MLLSELGDLGGQETVICLVHCILTITGIERTRDPVDLLEMSA